MRFTTCRLTFLLGFLVLAAPALAEPRKPLNVLFIAVDDLNNSLGCYGHPTVKTPNVDRLAARGVRFDRAYCQYPLCNPSRTSFLSGRRPDTTRVINNGTPPRQHLGDVPFLPEHFRKHGYFTARVGKIAHGTFARDVAWDVSEEPGRRPDAGRPRDRAQAKAKAQRKKRAGGAARLQWQASDRDDADEPDGRTARRVVALMEQERDRPFFLAAGFHKPHLPFVAPKKYFDLYPPDAISLPQEPPDDRADIPPVALTRTTGDDAMTAAEKRRAIAAYYACVSFMDAQVGVLLDAMDRRKLWDSTIVLLVGDHGWHLGEHGGLWRKMTVFEESARVPLIVAAPGKSAGASPRLVEMVDLYPTLADLCGLPAPDGLEGTSFAPLLEDPNRPWKSAAFTQVARGRGLMGRSVRTERYRYTEWDDQGVELYDHQNDPREHTNLAPRPEHAPTVSTLKATLHAGWRAALPKPGR